MKFIPLTWSIVFILATASVCFCQDSKDSEAIKREAVADLKGLHAAASKYIKDKGSWPQLPGNIKDLSEDKFYGFFKGALKPYGATEEMWKHSADQSDAAASYVPSAFDNKPSTPFRSNQPWFISRGTFPGSFIILPDGSISALKNLTGKMLKENP